MKTLMMTAVLAALALTAVAAESDRGTWHRFAAYDVGQEREKPCPMMDGKPCPYMNDDNAPCMKEPGKTAPCPMKEGKPCPHAM